MPIYQYKCKDCDHQLEALQKMSDPKLVDCPACNAPSLSKQVTAAAFKLKGTGWYETDFKNSGAKPQTQPETKSQAKTESKASETPSTAPAASKASSVGSEKSSASVT